jgi:hypothetical protein
MEQTLDIVENGQYKNLNLKPKPLKGIKGIEPENYVIVEKVFAEGYELDGKFGKSYSCKVQYKGEEVTFWLNEKEHDVYKEICGVGDPVKIFLRRESYMNPKTGLEVIYNKLFFEGA